jgi:transposase
MLAQVYGDNARKKTSVYKWVKRLSEERETVTDEERSGRPATSETEETVARIRQIVRESCRLTFRRIAEQVNVNRETVRKTLTEDLHMRKVCAKMFPQRSSPKNERSEEVFSY